MFKAFTLAEVLVTLTILGILASIIVPSVIQQYQKRVTITKLQKAYANLENAVTNIKFSTGCNNLQCTGLMDIIKEQTGSNHELNKKFSEIAGFHVTKEYNGNYIRAMYLYCEKSDCDLTYGDAISSFFTAKDGLGYRVSKFYDMIAIGVFLEPKKAKFGNRDTKMGRNYFKFVLTDDLNIEPAVFNNFGSHFPLSKIDDKKWIDWGCQHEGSHVYSGAGCAAKIISDGWKMNY